MSLVLDFTDKVVAVTGGARGVGRGVVEAFLEAGATVEFCGRTEPETLPEHSGRTARFSPVDVRKAEQSEAWLGEVVARNGRLDVLVNNVGGSPFGRFETGSPRYFQALTEINFLSAAAAMRAAFESLRESRGSVINITSISARRPSPGTAIYGAAKAALESLTRSVAVEWAPEIRVNAVSSGLVSSESGADHYGSEAQYAAVAGTIPRGRMAAPAELGAVCVMLASPLSAHVTGAVIPVDGGGEWPAFLSHTPHADIVQQADRAHPSGGTPS